MSIALIAAIASPFVYGLMNVLDKFVVSHKVKNPLSFSVIAGFVNLVIGILLYLILDWSMVHSLKDIQIPLIVGLLSGATFFIYFYLLSKEDVSNVIGLIYLYPFVVAILSYIFINERLSIISYAGMLIAITGVIMLSLKLHKIKKRVTIGLLIIMILVLGTYEFLIKLASNQLPIFNGVAITHIAIGLTVMLGIIHKKTREGIKYEIKNIKWALLNESLTFIGLLTIYTAMTKISATIVSSIASIQPLAVLLIEKIFNREGLNISKETKIRTKIIPITLIVIGIILLYLPEMIK